VLYAVTANGGEGVMNGILRREAGDSWSELGDQEELMIFRMLVASRGSGRRFVEGATRGQLPRTVDGLETTVPNYVVRVSDDDAQSFEEFPFVAPEDGSFLLAAIDPSNPDRILAYIDRDESSARDDRVLVSLDGGESFEDYFEITDFGGAAITTDGRVYIADRGSLLADKAKGLWVADDLETEPTALHTDRGFGCVGYQAATDTVFACELRAFGTIDQDSGEFSRLMKFDEVDSLMECAGEDVAMACQVQLCRDYCIIGHFPGAPMCEAYQSESCGPCSVDPREPLCRLDEGGSGAGGAGGRGGAGAGGAGGASASAGAGGRAGASGAAGTSTTGAGGSSQEPGDDDASDGGGCSCALLGTRATGARASGGLTLTLALSLGLFARAARRRRR
jgi:hypothetical protein